MLLRPAIVERHGLSEEEVDEFLVRIVENAIVREPHPTKEGAPDPGDDHLWTLLDSDPRAILVTGDRLLIEKPPRLGSVISPRAFVETIA